MSEADGCFLRYRCRVVTPNAEKASNVLGTLAAGGAATLVASWAAGRLMQRDAVVRPSRRLYEYCLQHRSAAVSRRLDPVTTIGSYSVIGSFSILVGGILAYERRDWKPLPLLIGGMVSEVYCQKALKRLVKGTFPPAGSSIGPPGDYPSGGAARTVITFGLLAHLLAQRWSSPAERRVIWSVATALVVGQGGSRLYLGRHWPEDVVGGWLLGYLILKTLTRVEGISAARL
jgi:membrane-associated phospholipid phosphatase